MRPLGPGHEIAAGTEVLGHLHRSNDLDVYDAWDHARACRVIAKTPRPDKLRAGPRAARSLLAEGRLMLRLSHPHVVRAYAVHPSPRPVLVMETLAGETVGHLIDQGVPLTAHELANLGEHLASALTHLHACGVLHLDLKPSNVVAERGRAKLIDLSHARRPGRVKAGHGTWCYMAPEQVRGGEVGPAADVWGLGIVLYGAARRTCPLADRADELDCDDPQLHGRLPPLVRLRPRLSRPLTTLIDACLSPEPDERPPLPAVLATLRVLTG